MTQVIPIERRSAVLTPSRLACLAHVPTINLTAGCAHECCYCYARGYLTHPGEGKVAFYTNTLERLRDELRRKRKKPVTVYFSPSSDPFQPVPEVLDMAYDVFKHLFDSGIGVTFVTKGRIPARHRELLAAHAPLVQGRIGVVTLDSTIAAAFEPYAAPPDVRLAQTAELIAAGIPIDARLDPILPGLTDSEDCLEPLCEALARAGVRTFAASVLFLRPAVIGSLRRHLGGLSRFSSDENGTVPFTAAMLKRLLDRFATNERVAIHAGNSRVTALPASKRLEIMERLKSVACRHGLRVLVCGCKNPDITSGSCHISGRWPPTAQNDYHGKLFSSIQPSGII
ncbi:MAG: radical SAM protein [Thermoguttaceae bacterium]|nr:radical SAM protein [Thermoguttaceae bacterium]